MNTFLAVFAMKSIDNIYIKKTVIIAHMCGL